VTGTYSRRRGPHLERAILDRFREAMPDADVRRGLQYRSDQQIPDVEVPCFWPELKHHHRTNIREAMRQAVAACPQGRWPVAICKDDRAEPLVTMQLEDFLELVSEWWTRRDR